MNETLPPQKYNPDAAGQAGIAAEERPVEVADESFDKKEATLPDGTQITWGGSQPSQPVEQQQQPGSPPDLGTTDEGLAVLQQERAAENAAPTTLTGIYVDNPDGSRTNLVEGQKQVPVDPAEATSHITGFEPYNPGYTVDEKGRPIIVPKIEVPSGSQEDNPVDSTDGHSILDANGNTGGGATVIDSRPVSEPTSKVEDKDKDESGKLDFSGLNGKNNP